ncbi:hypothetical protein CSV69_15775 [Sporosarcina sp. P26b]|uniref:DUF1819 family protein n=1 Tax=Sporosarcina sp. P26b TaxID=2048253 RepID=UPI000C16DCD5|nr:DUF1819 family protein [Sporosarcina sp. P26b]PIC94622.1 hypothetical protein CSV69_15775 [Sporosarcina sp. P26b]
MTMDTEYSSAMTGAAFMLYEFRQLAALKEQGMTDEEIRKKTIQENIFQHEKLSSLKRGLPSILRRINAIDDILLRTAAEGSLEDAKAVNLYAIMRTDRLFFEFMDEEIGDKLRMNEYSFEKRKLNQFFTVKAEQHEKIAGWTETTVSKLKQVYRRILIEAGYLPDQRSNELSHLLLAEYIKQHLADIGDANYIRAMGE